MVPFERDRPLWQWQELMAAFEPLTAKKSADFSGISGISIDSRTCSEGDLFIALAGDPGPRFHTAATSTQDGHQFLAAAINHGAAAVLVSRPPAAVLQTSFLHVSDTLDGLWQLGRCARQRMRGRVAAITGSAGKTTARGWLQQLLQAQAITHASTGSLNNHWGVPVSLGRMPAETEYGVFEVGTSHKGEIAPLSRLLSPHVALVLNVLPAHIGNFDSLEAIRAEKLSIVSGLQADGVLILPYGLHQAATGWELPPRITTFGLDPGADVSASAEYHANETIVSAQLFGKSVQYLLNAPGEHRVLTSLAVLAAAYHLGADIALAAAAMQLLRAPPGRGNEVNAGGVCIIDDSYNANPVSMSYAIDALLQSSHCGRKIACLGEMLELGDAAHGSHNHIMGKASSIECVFTVGEGFSACRGNWGHVEQADMLDAARFAARLQAGDRVLIKGSNRVFWQRGFVAKLVKILQQQAKTAPAKPGHLSEKARSV